MAYPGLALFAMIGVGLGLALWYFLADTTPEGAHTAGPQSQHRVETMRSPDSESWQKANVNRPRSRCRRYPKRRGDCAICTELMDNSLELEGVSCGHVFHIACIEKWREVNIQANGGDPKSSVTCPLCRRSI